jgi:hypothetical protein
MYQIFLEVWLYTFQARKLTEKLLLKCKTDYSTVKLVYTEQPKNSRCQWGGRPTAIKK